MFAVCLTDCLQKTDEVGEITQLWDWKRACWSFAWDTSAAPPALSRSAFWVIFLTRVGFQSMYQLFPPPPHIPSKQEVLFDGRNIFSSDPYDPVIYEQKFTDFTTVKYLALIRLGLNKCYTGSGENTTGLRFQSPVLTPHTVCSLCLCRLQILFCFFWD